MKRKELGWLGKTVLSRGRNLKKKFKTLAHLEQGSVRKYLKKLELVRNGYREV